MERLALPVKGNAGWLKKICKNSIKDRFKFKVINKMNINYFCQNSNLKMMSLL